MLRNLLVVLTGALLSYVFALAGSRLAWLLIIGNVENSDNKGALVRLMIVQTFVVIPGIAIMVGVFVGVLVQRSRWWLGGVTFLPFTVYGFIRDHPAGAEVFLLFAYLALAIAAAFIVSRFKHARQLS